ncbi:MAG: type IV toxin-antitoxin system AbiEi family antitoxin domain-containing protein [Clostridiales bacterium]|nr:type IV toxin-antitoxin system AbiEi family antitoxin domain-containing protein [Clostridiales bacterium]
MQTALNSSGGVIVTARQGANAGVAHYELLRGMKSGELERISRGIYVAERTGRCDARRTSAPPEDDILPRFGSATLRLGRPPPY